MEEKDKVKEEDKLDINETGIKVERSKEKIENMLKEYDKYIEQLLEPKSKEGEDNDRA